LNILIIEELKMVSSAELKGIITAIGNWEKNDCNIGEYLYERCSAYTGANHPAYCAELLNFAIEAIRSSKNKVDSKNSSPSANQLPKATICPICEGFGWKEKRSVKCKRCAGFGVVGKQ
jgi:hypothetical protein